MIDRTRLILTIIAVLIVLGQALIAVIPPYVASHRSGMEYVVIGYILGTIWSHVALAAAWLPLGPFRLGVRLPLSAILFSGGITGFTFQSWISQGSMQSGFVLVLAGCLLCQWLLFQIPFWIFVKFFRVRIVLLDNQTNDSDTLQFGIRQLFIVTTISAVVFAVARSMAMRIQWDQIIQSASVGPIVFLTIAAMIMILPLIVACLLREYSLPTTFIVILLIAAGTWIEYPLLTLMIGNGGGGPDVFHFIGINISQTLWVVVICTLLRSAGYGLGTNGTSAVGNEPVL